MASVIAPPGPTSPQQARSATPTVSPQQSYTSQVGVERHRFTVSQYHEIIKQGIFSEDDRVELIRGEILRKMAIGNQHAATVKLLNRLFASRLRPELLVSVQDPISTADSEPEPDIAILNFHADFYVSSHPVADDVLLLIEVADTSLAYDRDVKGRIYAEAGIREYWIVNLNNSTVEVYRDPQSDGRFATLITMSSDGIIRPLLLTDVSLRVDEILTPVQPQAPA